MSEPQMTICYNCRHFTNLEPDSVRADIWYNHICKAHPLELGVNPVTGKAMAISTNDLGQQTYGNIMFDYCRNHNTGSCPAFQPKLPV